MLRRPEKFHCAVVRDPVTDWTTLHTAFAERYLGLPEEVPSGGDVYAHHSLTEIAAEPPRGRDDARPLLLVAPPAIPGRGPGGVPGPASGGDPGPASGGVPGPGSGGDLGVLGSVLRAAGRPYEELPGGAPDLPAELAFVRRHLS